jgi:protocatechuate 3,4-dioxygenase beta subunit
MLRLIGFSGLSAGLFLAGCASSPSGSGAAASVPASASSGVGTSADAAAIPEETAGPYPADGSNGPDVLSQSGIVRSDIRSSFGEFSGTAEGVPLTIKLIVEDASNGAAPLAGAAVYLWHCDRDGNYSLYTVTDQNYLRGVQEAGKDGAVTFTSIFPACYSGRWPHIHFEVYPNLAAATDDANKIATSQIALPEDACSVVYATAGYEQSVQNLGQVSLATDNVFGDDGGVRELGKVTGSVDEGFTVELTPRRDLSRRTRARWRAGGGVPPARPFAAAHSTRLAYAERRACPAQRARRRTSATFALSAARWMRKAPSHETASSTTAATASTSSGRRNRAAGGSFGSGSSLR